MTRLPVLNAGMNAVECFPHLRLFQRDLTEFLFPLEACPPVPVVPLPAAQPASHDRQIMDSI